MIFDKEPVTRLIGYAAGIETRIRRITERAVAPAGLTYPQFGVLTAAAEAKGPTQRAIAERLETDVNTVMVVCNSLQAKGFITRNRDPQDGRVRRIVLTADGNRALREALTVIEGLYRPLVAAFPRKEIAGALPLMERLYGRLTEEERRPR